MRILISVVLFVALVNSTPIGEGRLLFKQRLIEEALNEDNNGDLLEESVAQDVTLEEEKNPDKEPSFTNVNFNEFSNKESPLRGVTFKETPNKEPPLRRVTFEETPNKEPPLRGVIFEETPNKEPPLRAVTFEETPNEELPLRGVTFEETKEPSPLDLFLEDINTSSAEDILENILNKKTPIDILKEVLDEQPILEGTPPESSVPNSAIKGASLQNLELEETADKKPPLTGPILELEPPLTLDTLEDVHNKQLMLEETSAELSVLNSSIKGRSFKKSALEETADEKPSRNVISEETTTEQVSFKDRKSLWIGFIPEGILKGKTPIRDVPVKRAPIIGHPIDIPIVKLGSDGQHLNEKIVIEESPVVVSPGYDEVYITRTNDLELAKPLFELISQSVDGNIPSDIVVDDAVSKMKKTVHLDSDGVVHVHHVRNEVPATVHKTFVPDSVRSMEPPEVLSRRDHHHHGDHSV